MNAHINDLFEAAQLLEDSPLCDTPEYDRCFSVNLTLEENMRDLFGPEAHMLLKKFLDSYYELERFHCLHYFYQGYLAAKKEMEEQKKS